MPSSRKERIEAMLRDDPNDPFLRYGLAMEHLGGGDEPAALAEFQELLRRTPDYVPGYQQAGQLLSRQGKATEARALFERGIAEAQRQGNSHAAQEMQGLLMMLE